MSIATRFPEPEAAQIPARECGYCHALFVPKRARQAFCSDKCRWGHHADIGMQGSVASVRRINRGVSMVIHLTGPAAEAAINLELRQKVRITAGETP